MKQRVLIVFVTIIAAMVPLAWFVSAQGAMPLAGLPAGSSARSVQINLAGEPSSLDPALAEDLASATVIEQLFVGLVDIDDETGEIVPELASSWEASPDATVYTFTLRADATWSDGNPITAQDVRYGILRTLEPREDSNYYAGILAPIIENGQAYMEGTITDPNLVGVTVLDPTHLRITMSDSAAYGLAILAQWVARPMPQWAIEAHGVPAWTEPGNIVTSGPYRLSEWVHNDHIILEKNPTYFDAANVQIEQVQMAMVDRSTAWQMYLDGELDTVDLPMGTSPDPIVAQEIHQQPDSAVFYTGFSVSQPPFDDPLVRKAFAAATQRTPIVNQVRRGNAISAQTFTPPGIFGHVDGEAEGVGLPYDPEQAQKWLAEAGYPGGAGLPPITYWHYSGSTSELMAQLLRKSWYQTLGVSVTTRSLSFSDILDHCADGACQMWMLGWAADYSEAYNYVNDALAARSRFGNWQNPVFDNLLAQARSEPDDAARALLYQQAEEILVERDPVIIPLYDRTKPVATKPYLERTYPTAVTPDIASWRTTWVTGTVDVIGGNLTSLDGNTTVAFPAGAFTATTILTYTPTTGMPPGGDLTGIDRVFDLTAVYSATGEPAQLTSGSTFTLSLEYNDAELAPTVREETLALYFWNGHEWVLEPSSAPDVVQNRVTAKSDHFSVWALFGEEKHIFLPAILRGG